MPSRRISPRRTPFRPGWNRNAQLAAALGAALFLSRVFRRNSQRRLTARTLKFDGGTGRNGVGRRVARPPLPPPDEGGECRGAISPLRRRNAELSMAAWTKLLLAGVRSGNRQAHVTARAKKLDRRAGSRRRDAQLSAATGATQFFSGLFVRNGDLGLAARTVEFDSQGPVLILAAVDEDRRQEIVERGEIVLQLVTAGQFEN